MLNVDKRKMAKKRPRWKREHSHTRRYRCLQELGKEAERCVELHHECKREGESQFVYDSHEAYEKIAAVIAAGASETVASVEKFKSFPDREDTSIKHNVLVCSWETNGRQCPRCS